MSNKYKIKGSGLPTLLTPKRFSFHETAEISEKYNSILESALAVDIICNIIKDKLEGQGVHNRVYLLNARTGSGKSTTLIQHLFDTFIRGNRNKMLVTEPRVPLCSANASEIVRWTEHPSEDKLGSNIGYITGPAKVKCTNPGNGCLYYCTAQILANSLNNILVNDNMDQNNIKIAVIDEAHLLDIPTLQTLNVVYNILEKYGNHPNCPIFIFASGTLNIDPFIRYFHSLFVKSNPKMERVEDVYKDCLMIGYVGGSANFDVVLSYNDNNLMKEIFNKTNKKDPKYESYGRVVGDFIINKYVGEMMKDIKENGNDLLLFVPKSSIIASVCESIYKSITKKEDIPAFNVVKGTPFQDVVNWRNQHRSEKRLLILGYGRGFSPAGDELLKTASEPDPDAKVYERKIIISTPIIEAGKTIASLRYCIDSGLELKPCYIPLIYNPYGYGNLKIVPINKSAATQRLGRVGREQTGECLRFYTEEAYKKLSVTELPETINNYCLSSVILSRLQSLEIYKYYDIINDNNYLYKISFDIQLRTIKDLINSGFFSIFSTPSSFINDITTADSLTNYIQQLYYNEGYSLFDALLIIHLNMKTLGNDITPGNMRSIRFNYDIRQLDRINPELDVIDGIKKARNIITKIIYDPTYIIYRYIYKRLFNRQVKKTVEDTNEIID